MISLVLLKNPKFAGNKNLYILCSIILFQVPYSEIAMLVSFDSSCKELKRGIIIILNFIVSTYLLALEVGGNFLLNLSLGPSLFVLKRFSSEV